jgi:hypothetical protein
LDDGECRDCFKEYNTGGTVIEMYGKETQGFSPRSSIGF